MSSFTQRQIDELETWFVKRNYESYKRASVSRNTTQAINTATWTALSFNTEDEDTDNIWGIGAPGRLTIVTPGFYTWGCSVTFEANATGDRGIRTYINGAVYKNGLIVAASTGLVTSLTEHGGKHLTVGDYLNFYVYQSSGGALDTSAVSGEAMSRAWIARIA